LKDPTQPEQNRTEQNGAEQSRIQPNGAKCEAHWAGRRHRSQQPPLKMHEKKAAATTNTRRKGAFLVWRIGFQEREQQRDSDNMHSEKI